LPAQCASATRAELVCLPAEVGFPEPEADKDFFDPRFDAEGVGGFQTVLEFAVHFEELGKLRRFMVYFPMRRWISSRAVWVR